MKVRSLGFLAAAVVTIVCSFSLASTEESSVHQLVDDFYGSETLNIQGPRHSVNFAAEYNDTEWNETETGGSKMVFLSYNLLDKPKLFTWGILQQVHRTADDKCQAMAKKLKDANWAAVTSELVGNTSSSISGEYKTKRTYICKVEYKLRQE